MSRKKTVHQIKGLNSTTEGSIPPWASGHTTIEGDNDLSLLALREWANEVTEHAVVEVAYGSGDISEFQRSDGTRMVIDADTNEEVASVSNRFNLVENDEVIRATADVVENFNLGAAVYGEARDFQDMMVLDLYFDVEQVTFSNPDTDDVMAAGIELQAANDGTSSVKVRPIVRDGFCRNTLRGIAEWTKMSHIKGEDEEHQTHYEKFIRWLQNLFLGLDG